MGMRMEMGIGVGFRAKNGDWAVGKRRHLKKKKTN